MPGTEHTETNQEHVPFPVGIDAVVIGFDDDGDDGGYGWDSGKKLTLEANHHSVENIALEEPPEGEGAPNAIEWYEVVVTLTAGVDEDIPTGSVVRRFALIEERGQETRYHSMGISPHHLPEQQGYTMTLQGTYTVTDEMRESYERGVRAGKELQES